MRARAGSAACAHARSAGHPVSTLATEYRIRGSAQPVERPMLVLLPLLSSFASAAAQLGPEAVSLRFATSYGDHMVLQQAPKQPVVWGRCPPTQCADVKLSVHAQTTGELVAEVDASVGGEEGTWIAKLPPTPGGDTPHTITATAGSTTARLTDVLFGDGPSDSLLLSVALPQTCSCLMPLRPIDSPPRSVGVQWPIQYGVPVGERIQWVELDRRRRQPPISPAVHQ